MSDTAAEPRVGSTLTPEAIAGALPGTFPGEVGVEPTELSDEHVAGRLVVERRHLHPGGYVHASVFVCLADSVAAWGSLRHLEQGQIHTTVELKMNLIAAGREGEELIATGVPMHLGRRTHVWEVRVEAAGELKALFVCTQVVLEPGAGS